MHFDNQKTRNVAEAAARIMAGETVSEELKGNQHKIDKNKNNKIDSEDFKLLRKEESEKETCDSCKKEKHEGECKMEEQIENIEEGQTIQVRPGVTRHIGTYGTAKGAEYGETDYDKENELAKSLDKKKPKKKAYGARQNYVRSTRVNETFSGLMSVYAESGLKGLAQSFIKEEPTNPKFKKELDAQQKKSETKVEEETVDIELVIDGQNGYDQVEIEERSLTADETAKKEDIVKGMKKGLAGFKERYGKDAKSVMYATATARAKGE